MPPTLIDIARETNTSVSTVSRVLAGGAVAQRISQQTRTRVLDAAKRMGYRPNLLARSLRTRKSNTIALLVSDIGNPFFAQIGSMIEQLLYPHGYSLLVCNSGEAGQREIEYLQMLPRKGIDGLIVVPLAQTKENLLKHFPADMPLVLLDRPVAGIDASVSSDQEQGAKLLCDALSSIGVRRVGLIAGPEQAITHRLRAQHICEHFKIAARQDGMIEMQTGMEAFETFKSVRFDAIVGTNSTLAEGYLRAMKSADKRLIVGCFDDIYTKTLMTVPVACAIQDLRGMAAGVVEQLLPKLRNESVKSEPILLPMHLETNQVFKERLTGKPVAAA